MKQGQDVDDQNPVSVCDGDEYERKKVRGGTKVGGPSGLRAVAK